MAQLQQEQLAAYLTAAANGGANGWPQACAMRIISLSALDRRFMWNYYNRAGITYQGHMRAIALAYRHAVAVRLVNRCQ